MVMPKSLMLLELSIYHFAVSKSCAPRPVGVALGDGHQDANATFSSILRSKENVALKHFASLLVPVDTVDYPSRSCVHSRPGYYVKLMSMVIQSRASRSPNGHRMLAALQTTLSARW
eukprot:6491747-Amphidinium_carterae.2